MLRMRHRRWMIGKVEAFLLDLWGPVHQGTGAPVGAPVIQGDTPSRNPETPG